jgi:hypothetical protein
MTDPVQPQGSYMMTKCLGVILATMMLLGCGGAGSSENPPPCFQPQPGVYYLNRDAIFVANAGSSSISALQVVGPYIPAGPVCGSPFPLSAPPTGLAGGAVLTVLSGPGKMISLFKVDFLTSVLTGPTAVLATSQTPVSAIAWGNYFYVANAEGNVSVYSVSVDGTEITEIPGSPFPAGSSPAGIAAAGGVTGQWLYVANSKSNDISAYSLDPASGVPTPLPGSPFLAGTNPSSIDATPLDPFHGGPTLAVVTNAGSNDVSAYLVGADGSLAPVPGSPFPAGAGPSSVTTGHIFYPVHFLYVANSTSNSISGYAVDDATGTLTPLGGSPFPAGSTPSSVTEGTWSGAFGLFLYVANSASNDLSVFSVGLSTGALTPVAGSPFPVGQSPSAVRYIQVPE